MLASEIRKEEQTAQRRQTQIKIEPDKSQAEVADPELARLRRRVSRLEGEMRKLRQELERERRRANIDTLTGIPNRRAYQQHLRETRARCQEEERFLSLVIWDIDHFKSINDRFGHQIGDQVLACVAKKISLGLRKTDFIARIGGEEFVTLLTDCDAGNARQRVEQLRRDMADCRLETDQGPLQVTLSCGIAEVAPNEHDATLFARADSALYKAKGEGRNRSCMADAAEAGSD